VPKTDVPSKFAEIVESIAQQGTASRLPETFARLPCDPALFDLPPDQDKLVERLRKQFGVDELLRHGVVQRTSDNKIVLSDLLSANDKFLRVVKRPGAKRPFDLLLGARGTLTGNLTMSAALGDAEFAARVKQAGGRVYIAASAPDVAMLNSAGLPAAPAHGLENIGGERLEEFRRILRGTLSDHGQASGKKSRSRSKSAAPAESYLPLSLVFVDWSLSRLSRDDVPVVSVIRDRLLWLAEHSGVNCDDHSRWKPSERQVERIKYELAHGSEDQIRHAIVDSLDDARLVLDRLPPSGHLPPGTIVGELVPGCATTGPGELIVDARKLGELQQAAFSIVAARLYQKASDGDNPAKQVLLCELASLSQSFLSTSSGSAKPLHIAFGNHGIGPVGAAQSDILRQQLAISQEIRAITKELRTWN
jgi:hypothetical protein